MNVIVKFENMVDISMNNNSHITTLARFPNLANVQVIVDFTISSLELEKSSRINNHKSLSYNSS